MKNYAHEMNSITVKLRTTMTFGNGKSECDLPLPSEIEIRADELKRCSDSDYCDNSHNARKSSNNQYVET